MAASQVESQEITAPIAGRGGGTRTARRCFLAYAAPAALTLACALSSCGKRGDLEPPPAAGTSADSEKEGAE